MNCVYCSACYLSSQIEYNEKFSRNDRATNQDTAQHLHRMAAALQVGGRAVAHNIEQHDKVRSHLELHSVTACTELKMQPETTFACPATAADPCCSAVLVLCPAYAEGGKLWLYHDLCDHAGHDNTGCQPAGASATQQCL